MPRFAPSAAVGAALVSATALALALSGCARDVPMTPAEDANKPACAEVIVRLPKELVGLAKRPTNAQATGAWGDPASIQLVCGETPSGPTTDPCMNVDGVDWIFDESQAPLYRIEAYGRTPGLAVYIDTEQVDSTTDALLGLGSVVKLLPQERQCTTLIDPAG